MSSINLTILAIGLPETARSIVGNGSIRPGRWINVSVITWAKTSTTTVWETATRKGIKIPSLGPCITAIFKKENALIMLINGLFYMTYCCVQASLSALFIQIYGFKEVYAGLIYIPFGIGCALLSFTGGRCMSHLPQTSVCNMFNLAQVIS